MSRLRTLATAAALTLSVSSARAADPERRATTSTPWSARFVRGTSAGEPSGAKVVTVLTLYGAGIVSLAGGIVLTAQGLSARSDTDEFASRQADGFCVDRSDAICQDYLAKRRDESDQLLLGGVLLGGSALFVLSGALTAELWSNRVVEVGASACPGGASLGVSARF